MPFTIQVHCTKSLTKRQFNVDPADITHEALIGLIAGEKTDPNTKFCILYVDDEQDFVSIDNTDDLKVAVDLFQEKQVLKLFVSSCPAGPAPPTECKHKHRNNCPIEKKISYHQSITKNYFRGKFHSCQSQPAASPPTTVSSDDGAVKNKSFGDAVVAREFALPATSASGVGEYGTATFGIKAGTVLKSHDVVGKGDPYVLIKINGKEKKSTVKKDTQTPVWNESIIFENVQMKTTDAVIEMWDKDNFTKDDFIGSATIQLDGAINQKKVLSPLILSDEKGEYAGEVNIEVELKG